MTKFVFAAVIAAGLTGLGSTAYAGMGIPDLTAQPITTQTTPDVIGEVMPQVAGPARPVVAERFNQAVVGEATPEFGSPNRRRDNGPAYAQIGRVQSTAAASLAPLNWAPYRRG
ncbi:hypothetical protein [Acidiphilium sp.]|uniref:hypothetical protein n=1 Tax=Acidiphilium sp. TaxID=527 RepID=UPI003D041C9F